LAYTINKTDGSIFAVVADGTVNTDTSLALVGKNYPGYGEFLNENMFRLLESHANATQPVNPIVGQLWYDKAANVLKVFNGTQFRSLGGAIAGTTAPTGNNNGDFWWDSNAKQLKVWDTGSNAFIVVGPLNTAATGQSGSIPTIITDNTGGTHVVVQLLVQDQIVGIISKDATFTPNPAIAGFGTIQPGINLSSASPSRVLAGTATNADGLGGHAAAQYVRKNDTVAQTVAGNFGVLGNQLTAGSGSEYKVTVTGTSPRAVTIANDGALGTFTFKTPMTAEALTIANNGNVGIAGALSVGGAVTAASFSGVGTNLTALNASQLTTGTVPDARISGSYTGLVNLTGSGTATFGTFAGSGASLTNLNANNLTTGTVPNGRLGGNYAGLGTITPSVTNNSDLGSTSLVWANVYASTLHGNISASQITSGVIPDARVSGSYTGLVNLTGTGTATFGTFAGSGASLTALNASQLTTGTVPDGRISGAYTGLGTITPAATNTSNLGSSALRWAGVYATEFYGSGANLTGVVSTTAATLATPRNINGTSFNGSADITTANWGTARTLTIGATGKTVNGSANISWSLAEIGAAAATHTHDYLPLSGGTMTGAIVATNSAAAFTTANWRKSIQMPSTAALFWPRGSSSVAKAIGATTDNNIHFIASPNDDGTGAPTTPFSFNMSNGNFTATGDVTAYSDARLKKDLVKISDAVAKVQQLTGYTYTRIDTGERQTGVVAQDVQKVLPEAVKDGEHLSVAYGNMVGLLIEAIKEQQLTIGTLEKQVALLVQKVSELDRRKSW